MFTSILLELNPFCHPLSFPTVGSGQCHVAHQAVPEQGGVVPHQRAAASGRAARAGAGKGWMCSGTCFLQSSWFGKENIYTRAFPCLTLCPPSPALQVSALTHLGTHGAIPMPQPGSGRAPRAALLQTPCLCQPSQTTRANATCHRTDKCTEVEPTIFVC